MIVTDFSGIREKSVTIMNKRSGAQGEAGADEAALRVLEAEGLVTRIPGLGYYVVERF